MSECAGHQSTFRSLQSALSDASGEMLVKSAIRDTRGGGRVLAGHWLSWFGVCRSISLPPRPGRCGSLRGTCCVRRALGCVRQGGVGLWALS